MRWRPVQRNPRAVLGAVKAWLGSMDTRGEACATASRRPLRAARLHAQAGTKERATRHEQKNSASKDEEEAVDDVTNNIPYPPRSARG
jgi:hypothetical protein